MASDNYFEATREFLRTKLEPFKIQDFQAFLKKKKIKLSIEDAYSLISSSGDVFTLINETFLTRAGAFTGRLFSFKPFREEVEAGAFIPGHRFMPFADPMLRAFHAMVLYKDQILEPTPVTLSTNTVLDLNALYGEGYCVPVILEDPACEDIAFSDIQYGLPTELTQSGFSLQPLINDGFEFGDRILCRVLDWDKNIIELTIKKEKHQSLKINFSDMEQEEWYSLFEEAMLDKIERHGPCGSIEQQLALLFLEEQNKLCHENCGAIDEFLTHTTKVGFSNYGIESRIWKIHEEVPYVGKWNKELIDSIAFPCLTYLSEDYVLNSVIKDKLFRNEPLDSPETLFDIVYPKALNFSDFERRFILLHLEKRIDIVKNEYNKFLDYPIAKARHSVILVFNKLMDLVAKISSVSQGLDLFPQQELIILSQMAEHVNQFLEQYEMAPSQMEAEQEDMLTSLHGMSETFDSIEGELLIAYKKAKKIHPETFKTNI